MFAPPLFLTVSGRCLTTAEPLRKGVVSLRLDRMTIGSDLAVISVISHARREADEISTKYIRLKMIGHASSPTSNHLHDLITYLDTRLHNAIHYHRHLRDRPLELSPRWSDRLWTVSKRLQRRVGIMLHRRRWNCW
jgi:hypothetical protein